VATVRFADNFDRISGPARARVEAVIRNLLEELVAANDTVEVAHHAARDEDVWEIDFTLGGQTRTLRLEREDADVDNPHFQDFVRAFLVEGW
jgi:hypothetical protein